MGRKGKLGGGRRVCVSVSMWVLEGPEGITDCKGKERIIEETCKSHEFKKKQGRKYQLDRRLVRPEREQWAVMIKSEAG